MLMFLFRVAFGRCGFMSGVRRWMAVVLAAVAGVLLLVSGVRGPVGTYELVRQQLPVFIHNVQVLQVVNVVAVVLIAIALGVALVTTGQVAAVVAQHSSVGWAGVILAFAARIVAK
jgi:hypothetical protein